MRTLRNWLKIGAAATGLVVALTATPALAGEFKFGEGIDSLQVDDKGKLTADSKKNALKELDKIPGEDEWDLNLWASLDGGRDEGPLYIEFWQKVQGNDAIVYRHEMNDYDGRRQILVSIILEGNVGFNKDRTYKVKAVQVNSRGKDLVLATGSLKLINTGRKVEEEEGAGEGGEEERESASQDELDSLAGPDEEDEPDAEPVAPPPVEPAKKGCSVAGEYDAGFNGLMILALAGLGLRRRKEQLS
jgi:MYXO-CTERM domain-containing protein